MFPSDQRVLILYTGGRMGEVYDEVDERFHRLRKEEFKETYRDLARIGFATEFEHFLPDGRPIDQGSYRHSSLNALAHRLSEAHAAYDGVVVIGDISVLRPVAASIEYQMRGVSKPIVLTTSRLPANAARNDAEQNLLNATFVAGTGGGTHHQGPIKEIAISAGNLLLRPTRAAFGSRDRESSSPFETNEKVGINGQRFAPGVIGMYGAYNVEQLEIYKQALLPQLASTLTVRELDENLCVTFISPSAIDDYWFEAQVRAAINERSPAIVFYESSITPGSSKHEIARTLIPSNLPVFYCGNKRSPEPAWISPPNRSENAFLITDYHQLYTKITYILSLARDVKTLRRLFAANLRGENNSPLENEEDILREAKIPDEGKTELRLPH